MRLWHVLSVVNVVLYQPEIPQNAGNIARTCAATSSSLHLVRPLGFRWASPQMKRAGLDYWERAEVHLHDSWDIFVKTLPEDARVFALSSKAKKSYTDIQYQPNDYLLFGPETRGLPPEILEHFPAITIPMPGKVRSLNLAVSVGVVVFEALRQFR